MGAYDVDNNRIVFNYIPFADHRALLDLHRRPGGRCLKMLATLGYIGPIPRWRRRSRFVKNDQNGTAVGMAAGE